MVGELELIEPGLYLDVAPTPRRSPTWSAVARPLARIPVVPSNPRRRAALRGHRETRGTRGRSDRESFTRWASERQQSLLRTAVLVTVTTTAPRTWCRTR